jgi:hypothetical protein
MLGTPMSNAQFNILNHRALVSMAQSNEIPRSYALEAFYQLLDLKKAGKIPQPS